jgi:hypothetical protein
MQDISQRCARSLGKLDPSIERDGARLRFAGRDVRLRARVENEAGTGAQHLLGLAVDVEVDGVQHPVTDGVVGIGATRDEAVDAAIHWWSRIAGAPIVAALGGVAEWPVRLDHEGVSVFMGETMVRAAAPVEWPGGFREHMVVYLWEVLRQLPPLGPTLHALSILFSPSESAGEVRVDGVPLEQPLLALATFAWPNLGTDYSVRQVMIVRPQDE